MNYYDFSGGIVNQKSPYLMKTNELLDLTNLDVEGGGLTVRDGTQRKYGPFSGEVTNIHKALSTKGHEILFVQCKNTLHILVAGVMCNLSMTATNFKVLPVTDGFTFLYGGTICQLKPIYRRVDGVLIVEHPWEGYLVIERLPEDYSTSGDFPADLYGTNIWDEETNILYYAKSHTDATRENIRDLLGTSQFVQLGKLGDLLHMKQKQALEAELNLRTLYCSHSGFERTKCYSLSDVFEKVATPDATGLLAIRCPYIVWHPASMRYFAGGHPDHPTALYISEPNDWKTYSQENVLYPHLHLGKITGLSVVEKSVVVAYEYGWSHYVGSDPTEDGQWSLLSVPDGTPYGKTVCSTPGSVSFLSESGLMNFSSSMLTVQMLYSPSSSLYKFLSRDKIRLPKPEKTAFSYYKNGVLYLVIDSVMYLYNFYLSAFLCYEGITCSCMTEDYDGNILMGSGRYVTAFAGGVSTDYDPKTDTDVPISYHMTAPVLGTVKENEIARCEEVVVKALGMPREIDCYLKLSSEKESREGKLLHTNHLMYGNTNWKYRYLDSEFSESFFPWKVSGNIFLLEVFGTANPADTKKLTILNIYLHIRKERDKL
ncbi:MAG: hypothetical protein J6A61_06745 [Clostridia bacterium]|nr:hypothetical protein [Clostridia bacterium]